MIKTGRWDTFNRLLIRTGLADTTGRIQVFFFIRFTYGYYFDIR